MTPAAPSGVVTFLFTDVEGSTRRWEAGANVKAVQKMLGHASAAMTLDIYADLFDDDLEAVATDLDEARARESVGKMWARPRRPTQ